MNISQIIKKARVDADAIRLDQTVSPLWNDLELVDLANEVIDSVIAPQLRLTRRHQYVRRMLSSDPPVTIFGQVFDPSGLRITTGRQHLVLPPDFIEIVRITPLTTNANTETAAIRFKPRDVADPAFIESDMADQVNPGTISTNDFFYDILGGYGATDIPGGGFGNALLRITPLGANTVDIELLYVARQPSVYLMQIGTVATSNITVSGDGATGQDFTLVPLPAEIIISMTPSTPVTVDTNLQYLPVQTISGSTSLTVVSPTVLSGAGLFYQLASVPPVPLVHHRWIANMVTDLMVRKISPQLARERLDVTTAHWREQVLPDLSAPRQSQEPVYTVPFIPDLV